MLENKYPLFKKNEILEKEMLDLLRDNPMEIYNLLYMDFSDGIVNGFNFTIDSERKLLIDYHQADRGVLGRFGFDRTGDPSSPQYFEQTSRVKLGRPEWIKISRHDLPFTVCHYSCGIVHCKAGNLDVTLLIIRPALSRRSVHAKEPASLGHPACAGRAYPENAFICSTKRRLGQSLVGIDFI